MVLLDIFGLVSGRHCELGALSGHAVGWLSQPAHVFDTTWLGMDMIASLGRTLLELGRVCLCCSMYYLHVWGWPLGTWGAKN